MSEKSGGIQFWMAFFIAAAILTLPFSYALFKFSNVSVPQVIYQENYFPQSSDSITILLALKDDFAGEPDCFVAAEISPQESAILMAVLPPEILVEDGGSFRSAKKVWGSEGAKRAVSAIENALGIEIDRWLELDREAIVRLGSTVGAIDFTLDEEVSLENGLLTLPAQRQLIDGTRAALLVSYDGYSGGEQQRLEMVGRLAEQMIYQRLPLMDDRQLLEVFETAVNNGSSDLAISDFESRRRALTHMISSDIKVELLSVFGEYSGAETFLLSSESLEMLQINLGHF